MRWWLTVLVLLASPAFAADVRVTSAAASATSGNQDITISGFGTPTAAIVIASHATAQNTDTDHANLSIGFTDGTNQAVSFVNAKHVPAGNSDNHHGHSSSLVVNISDPGSGTILRSATASFITDGIRLNWVESGTQYQVKVILFTGVGSTLAGTFTPNATQNSSSNITTTFTTKLGFFAQNDQTNTNNQTFQLGFGAMHYSNPTITQRAIMLREENNTATPTPDSHFAVNRSTIGNTLNSGTPNFGTEVTAVGATSVTLTTRDGTGGGAVAFLLLEIPNNAAWVGTVDAPASGASDWVVTGPAFEPDAFGLVLTDMTAVSTAYGSSNLAGPLGIYTADAEGGERTVSITRENGAVDTQSRFDTKLYMSDHAGAADLNMTGPTFTASGFTFPSANITSTSASVLLGWAIESGLLFTTGPTVAAATNGYTISGTLSGSGTLTAYAVACVPAETAPSAAQVKTGDCGSGADAAIAANEVWTTDVGDSFALTAASSLPCHDVYVVGSDGTTDTTVTAAANEVRSADSGQTIVNGCTGLASVSPTSVFADTAYFDPDVVAGDVVEADSTTSGACAITWETDGDFSFSGCSTQQTIGYCIQDVSSTTSGQFTTPACWASDDTIWVNNGVPVFDDEESYTYVFDEDIAITPIDYDDFVFDPDSDPLTYSVISGTLPNGLTLTGATGVLAGTPDTEDEAGASVTIQVADPAGDTDSVVTTMYVVNTWTMPDITNQTMTEAEATIEAAAPWIVGQVLFSFSNVCSEAVAANDIITQSPVASAEVDDPFQTITVTVSGGECRVKRTKGVTLPGVSIGN